MRRPPSWLIALSLGTALVAGATPLAAQKSAAPDRTGTYRFEERSGADVVTQGTFTLTADSVSVDAVPGPCRYSPDSRPSGPIIYTCGNTTLSFDRQNPLARARVTFPKRVVETQRVCRIFTTDSRGQQVCSRYDYDQTERFVSTTIRLRATRVGAP